MIFISLGTQNHSFERLLKEIEECIDLGIITQKVIIQAGYTQFFSNKMEVFDYVDADTFATHINECELFICHGGVGSILTAIQQGKKVIAIARLKKYKEHVNDHQVEIIQNFHNLKYILGCSDISLLKEALRMVGNFNPEVYKKNNTAFCQLIETLL